MIVQALVQAMDRRVEVSRVIGDEAIRRVGQLLDVGELGSRFVLDPQGRRINPRGAIPLCIDPGRLPMVRGHGQTACCETFRTKARRRRYTSWDSG
ncbi:hypothetical protein JOE31_002700 [Arthrobacter sp. PvP023]|nr:hypothetical protein [Arthrobacter sp. PvP023]